MMSKRVGAILLSLMLAACAVTHAPVGTESVTSHLEDGVLVAADQGYWMDQF